MAADVFERPVEGAGVVGSADDEGVPDLGCEHALLDSYYDDIEATRNSEAAWRMLAMMAETVLDLANETLR